jgi:hypothetical protein
MDLDFLEQTAAEADRPGPGQGGRAAAALAILAGQLLLLVIDEAGAGRFFLLSRRPSPSSRRLHRSRYRQGVS